MFVLRLATPSSSHPRALAVRLGRAPGHVSAVMMLAVALLGCSSDDADDSGSVDASVDANFEVSGDADGDVTDEQELGLCAQAGELGDPCPEGDDRACAGPLRCTASVCSLESLAGEPCDYNSDCIDDHYCQTHDLEGRELPNRTCAPEPSLGDPCPRYNTPCGSSSVRCIRGLCQDRSGSGGPCESDLHCEGDAFCNEVETADDGALGVCQAELDEGDPCREDNDGCGDGLNCFDGVCELRRAAGEACRSGSDCGSGLYCDRYTDDGVERSERQCATKRAEGDSCDPRESGNCDSSNCVAGTCVDDQPLDAACERSGDCAEDLFCLVE